MNDKNTDSLPETSNNKPLSNHEKLLKLLLEVNAEINFEHEETKFKGN